MNHLIRRSRLASTGAAVLATMALGACSPATSASDAASQTGPAAGTDAPAFEARPALSPTAEALPRLVGDSAAIRTINADLDRIDAADRANLQACLGGEWNRTVLKPMTGPGYLTLAVAQDWYCGGAYPVAGQTAVTYDLGTGERVDWVRALPAWTLTSGSLEGMPEGYVPTVSSTAMAEWYSRKMLAGSNAEWVEQCRSVYDAERWAELSFRVWADAETNGLMVAAELPHVVQACAEVAVMTGGDMRAAGVAPAMIEAIAAAHAAGHWVPRAAPDADAA